MLGNVDHAILLKQVITKVEYNSKRIDEFNHKLIADIELSRKDQEKTNNHLMDTQTMLQTLMANYNDENKEKIKS